MEMKDFYLASLLLLGLALSIVHLVGLILVICKRKTAAYATKTMEIITNLNENDEKTD